MRFQPARLIALFCLVTFAFLFTACSTSGKKEYVFAPTVSIKEMAQQSDGWRVTLTVNNLSNVTHTIEQVDLDLSIGAQPLGRLSHIEQIEIPSQSSDPIVIQHNINTQASQELQTAASQGMPIHYQLKGTVHSSQPDVRNDDVSAQGTLEAVPGLQATFR